MNDNTLKKVYGLHLHNLLEGTVKRVVRIGGTLRVWIGTPAELERMAPQIEKEKQRALNKGDVEVEEAGVVQWTETSAVFDRTQSGSNAYLWKGDKVKAERFLFTRKGGEVSKESLGFVWKDLLKIL
jgi:hypothetical protein